MATQPQLITPFETLNADDTTESSFDISTLPPEIQGLITDFEAPEYIAGALAQRYKLEQEQQEGVARFLMEAVLRKVTEAGAVSRMSELAEVSPETALEMLRSIEENLLSPNDFTLSGLINGTREPSLAVDAKGREGLRYANLNDLMQDLEPLTSDEREQFLSDAKPFNRVFVLQALSQLKLGTDSSGRSLTLRQLVAREAGEFSAQDWNDALTVDPDILAEPEILKTLTQTPLGAALTGKDAPQSQELLGRVRNISPGLRRLLVDSATSTTLSALIQNGTLPASHLTAALKIVSFLALGEVPDAQVSSLLMRLGIAAQPAALIASTLTSLVSAAAGGQKAMGPQPPPSLKPLQPLTARIGVPVPPRPPGLPPPARNIIDLRNNQQT